MKHDQKRVNSVNPKKIPDSKWTAIHPQNSEKHFVVVNCSYSSLGVLEQVGLEAIYTGNIYQLHWRELKDGDTWKIGWV